MNPPPNVLPGMDGYFRTRKLDACKHGIVDAVLDREGGRRNAALRGSGPPEKVFNELWKPSRGRLGVRRDCKVLDNHKAVDLSLQVGV